MYFEYLFYSPDGTYLYRKVVLVGFPPCFVSKQAAIGSFEQVATLLELPLKSHNGARRYTGHCMRVTGAVFLAKSGVDVWRIMALGRWGSDYS